VRPDRSDASGPGISSNPQRTGTGKARNLAANPACTFAVGLEGIDLVLEGEAARVTDRPTLERVARRYRDGAVTVGTCRAQALLGRELQVLACGRA
jgi:hypothetical protein